MPVSRLDTNPNAILPPPSLEQIAENVWIHKSYKDIPPWGPVLSQGVVLKTGAEIILIDTAWTDEDTKKILILIKEQLGGIPSNAIVTHAHEDKMGGMNALHEAGIETTAYLLTNEDAPARGLTPAKNWFGGTFDGRPTPAPYRSEKKSQKIVFAYPPGHGHTRDNIVIFHAPSKVLFGGCLIRPGDSSNLGNTADADIEHWAQAVSMVATTFPDAQIVIPSHGAPGGRELLDHTVFLAEKAAAKRYGD